MALTIGFTSVPPTVDGMLMWACCRIPHFLAIENNFLNQKSLGFILQVSGKPSQSHCPQALGPQPHQLGFSCLYDANPCLRDQKRMRLPVRSTKRNSPKHIRFPTRHQKKLEEEGIGNLLTFCGRMDPNLRQKITSTKHLVSFSFPQDWSNVGTPEKIFPVCLFVFCECVCVCVWSLFRNPLIYTEVKEANRSIWEGCFSCIKEGN